MPATATLLATIARLPHGAVVLPGLDMDLDKSAWDLIAGRSVDGQEIVAPAVGHPQYAMRALLKRLGVERDEVRRLGAPSPNGREKLLSRSASARPLRASAGSGASRRTRSPVRWPTSP